MSLKPASSTEPELSGCPRFTPPRPPKPSKAALLGGLFSSNGRSMLSLLPPKAYEVQMGSAQVGGQRMFVVNAPDTIRDVMVRRPNSFPKHPYLADILKPLIGVSLFNANGAQWHQQRRLVDQAFTQAGLRQAFPTMLAAIEDMVSRLIPLADGSPWQADAAMSHVTADIIYRTILSKPLSQAQANQVHADFTAYQHYAQRVMGLSALRLPTWYHRARCRSAAASIRATFADVVQQRFSSVQAATTDGPQDMLDALIKARDPDTGATLTEEGLVDQVGTLFLAGHETSASTLAWALYLLARQPQWQQRLREQVWALWPCGATPAFGDSRQLHGLHDLFRETLRLYPPIAFYVRQARQDECLRDKPVPAGSLVAVSSWLVHRHSGFWEDPAVFDPARFGTAAGQQSAKHAYLPFGLGPRACPGAAFATQESILILALLLRSFRVEAVANHVPKPVARLTLRSANGIVLRLYPAGN